MPTLLGFDFGTARIGVAIGETETGTAQPLETIRGEANVARFARIATLIEQWQPQGLVVGIPFHEDGRPHEMTTRCERFANQLNGRFNLSVARVDERFTSSEAEDLLRDVGMGWQKRKEHIDALAAQRILQSYLDAHEPTRRK